MRVKPPSKYYNNNLILLDKCLNQNLVYIAGIMYQISQLPNGGSSLESVASWIFCDAERHGIRFPDILLIVIVFTCDYHTVGNQE